MLKRLLNPFFRILKKNKPDAFINLVGLSFAMLVVIFTAAYVKNETTFDAYHPNADRIFRLTTSIVSPDGQSTDMALANTSFGYILKNECPEIEEIAYVDVGGDYKIKYRENEFDNLNIRKATPSIFRLFSYPTVRGESTGFLHSPKTVILTKSLAEKIFQNSDPLGQRLTIGNDDYEVTGVIDDLPSNTDLKFSALIPSEADGTEELADWGEYYVYLQTTSNSTKALKEKIDTLTHEKYHELLLQMGGFGLKHHLQALKGIHFDNSLLVDTPKGNKTLVYVFSVVGILILIIAGINYMNITIARLQQRQKEFAIRKTIGCSKKLIFYQIIAESVLTFLVAALLSLALTLSLLPQFNSLFHQQFQPATILRLLIPLLTLFFVFAIAAGLYPAYKSSKTDTIAGTGFNFLGKTLVTFQNVISIVMIAGVFLIWSQVRFMKNHNLGFDQQQLIAVKLGDPAEIPGKNIIRNEFSKLPEVRSLAFGGGGTNLGVTDNWMKAIMVTKNETGNDLQFVLNQPNVDENYIALFGIQIVEGRNFSLSVPGDRENAVIINETYAKKMGWTEPLGKYVYEDQPQQVIGVVKDFNFEALNNPVEPLMFQLLKDEPEFLFLKAEPWHLEIIRNHWKKITADAPFEYSFIDKRMDELYAKNEKEMAVFSLLTLIALVISCLGLYGLTSHFVLTRTKEIGIRKVNGARISEVLIMLNRDFVKWVAIAFVIATPIAYYAMNKWLENFAYKTELSWWIFALAGLLALGIALLTVSFQSWKAATKNPVEALRYE